MELRLNVREQRKSTKVMFSLNENVRGLPDTWLFKDPESWVGQKFMFIISSPQYICTQSIGVWCVEDLISCPQEPGCFPESWWVWPSPEAAWTGLFNHFLISWHPVTLYFLCSCTSKAHMDLYYIHKITHLVISNYWANTCVKPRTV